MAKSMETDERKVGRGVASGGSLEREILRGVLYLAMMAALWMATLGYHMTGDDRGRAWIMATVALAGLTCSARR